LIRKRLIALKLDMERAYDMMRWDFIISVMKKFGIDDKFVDLVMGCIREHAFSVLINGSGTEWLRSNVELRGWVPKGVLEKIDFYCRRFLWSKDGEQRGLPLIARDKLCRSKEGMGLRMLKALP